MEKLTCAMVTLYPMPDVRAYSGISYHMAQQMERSGIKVHYVTASLPEPSLLFRLRRKIYRKVFNWGMRVDREPAIMKPAARELDRKLRDLKFDFIFGPGSLAVPYLENPKPKFFWSDATFAGYINFNVEFSGMSPETIRKGNALEQLSIENCDMVFYSSDWAAQTALDNYRVSPDKVRMVPFGANFEVIPDGELIRRVIREKECDCCRLLFVGVEWERKGGPLILKVVERLVSKGRKVRLDIVGSQPEIPEAIRANVTVHGFVSKKTEEGRALFTSLFEHAHFLTLPATHEACAIAFCEALAYGLPVIASQVGGCATVVRDGITGQLFPVGTAPDLVADHLDRVFSDVAGYRQLSLQCRNEFELRYNWPTAVNTVMENVKKFL